MSEKTIPDELARWMSASDGKLEVTTEDIRSVGLELLRHRAATRRVATILYQMERSSLTDRIWAAELRAAVDGRKFLYRCPEHGDRTPIAHRHAGGVRCGVTDVVRGVTCFRTAILVGEVDYEEDPGAKSGDTASHG